MPDDNANSYRNPGEPRLRPGKNASGEDAHRSPWDNEPAWPGTEYDDDEAEADEMSDDDNDPPWPWLSPAFGFQQPSLWDEALDKIFASKARSGSA
ncbi:MAG: hypothetical protein WCG85_16460 [Polyangia bacterium]